MNNLVLSAEVKLHTGMHACMHFGAQPNSDSGVEVPQAPKRHKEPTFRESGRLPRHNQRLTKFKKFCLSTYPHMCI